jgi:EAL and modified HD-GYP domain-containing signal transduction protein
MSTSAFLGRQPVLNRNQQLIGYELLFRRADDAASASPHAPLEADTQVLVNALNNMGTTWLIGNKLAFINVGETMLTSDFLELLPPRRVVLDLAANIQPTNEVVSRVRYLRSLGFGISLDDFSFDAPSAALLELANYVKLDVQSQTQAQFQSQAARLRSYPVIRIGERIETYQHYNLCRDLAMDGYQGYYFARPETLSAKVIHPSFSNTLKLLNLLRADAPVRDIEIVLKTDVALSFKLLRYVNSAAAGLNTTISSFSHAVTVLGYQKLYRWLTLLLVTSSENQHLAPALQKTAVIRARLMEILALNTPLGPDHSDNAFIAGMFSLLDVIFDMPMPSILEHISLPAEIHQVLADQSGSLSMIYRLALALETADPALPYLAQQLSMTPDQLNLLHTTALAWVEELGL